MLEKEKFPKQVQEIVSGLAPIHASIRGNCAALGIDVEAAERSAARHADLNGAALPWQVTPKECAREILDLFSIRVGPKSTESQVVDELMSKAHVQQSWALLGSALVLEQPSWNNDAKRTLIQHVLGYPGGKFDEVFCCATLNEIQEQCAAMLSWLVYNAMARPVIERSVQHQDLADVLDVVMSYEVKALALMLSRDIQGEVSSSEHPLTETEPLLLKLGNNRLAPGPLVASLVASWSEGLQQGLHASSLPLAADAALEELLPPPQQYAEPESATVARDATQLRDAFLKNLAFSKALEGLIDRDEWGNPLKAARELMSQELVRLYILQGSFSSQSEEIIRRLLEAMPERPSFVLTSSALELATADGAPVEEILEGLRDFLATGRRSFAELAGVSERNSEQLDHVVALLEVVRASIGGEKIHLVMDRDIDKFLAATPDLKGMIIGPSSLKERVNSVEVNLSPDSPDEGAMEKMRRDLEHPAYPLRMKTHAVRSATKRFVVPLLAELHGGADDLGLVGWKSAVALELAKKTHIGARALAEKGAGGQPQRLISPEDAPALTIQATRDSEEEDIDVPEDAPAEKVGS